MKKILSFLLLILVGVMWLFPSVAPILSIVFLLFSLSVSVSSIIKKHKGLDNPRPKIIKDISILITNILLITFFGGLAGLIANFYTKQYFGAIAGFISAIVASFVVAYLIKKGIGQLFKQA